MRKVLLLILLVPGLGLAQEVRKGNAWSPFSFFIGTWKGTGKGDPGISQLERQYKFIFDGKYIEVKHKSVYAPQEKNPKGETHEELGFFSYDRRGKQPVFRQFHTEGFVIQYRLESITEDGKVMVFLSESIENIPPGWKARETYRVLNEHEFAETFELAGPGKEFSLYSENHFKRQK
ncbi:MAG: hypothetical protein M3539_09625 [Acidobacteriota bacterium]|nr:hypothetical protein [Acidobacteriota bacterium]